MINLYQILHISPYSSEAEIRAALNKMETGLNERTIKAVYEWLLVDAVRARYDMKLREAYPEYFAQFRQQQMLAANTSQNANKRVITRNIKKSSGKTIRIKKRAELSAVDYRADVPELWNPNAAANWCIVFNVVFGATLHALNWTELGEDDLARKNWIVAALGFGLILCAMLFSNLFNLLNLLLLIVWYFALAKKQAAYVQKELGGQYQKKGWGVPIGITIAVGLGLILLLVILSGFLNQAA